MRRLFILVSLVTLASLLVACEAVSRSASQAFDNANSAIKDKVFVDTNTTVTPTPATPVPSTRAPKI